MVGLRKYARISKSKIKYILDTFIAKSKKAGIKIESNCLNCNLNKDISSFKFNNSCNEDSSYECVNNYCSKYCNKKTLEKFEDIYYAYEKETSYGTSEIITDSFKCYTLNKSALKQYLLYHFIPGNKNWLKKGVSFNDIASLTGLSLPTVKKNHKLLVEAGLIHSSYLGLGRFNFIIADEYKNHLPSKEGGTGYISLSLESLEHLLSFKSVNELRVELLKFLWVDAKTGSLGKKIRFNKDNLIQFLPEYIKKSKKKVNDIINSSNSLFKCDKGALNTINYETSSSLLNRLKVEAKERISALFKGKESLFSSNCSHLLQELKSNKPYLNFIKDDLEHEFELEKELIIHDLSDIAVQYGLDKVENAIKYMLSDRHQEIDSDLNICKTDIDNPAAFVRAIIVNSINSNGSLENNVVLYNSI